MATSIRYFDVTPDAAVLDSLPERTVVLDRLDRAWQRDPQNRGLYWSGAFGSIASDAMARCGVHTAIIPSSRA